MWDDEDNNPCVYFDVYGHGQALMYGDRRVIQPPRQ